MLALVTGANGFIGSHLVDTLLELGHPVRAFVRPKASLAWLSHEAEIVKGHLTDRTALTSALQGVGVVFHVAGAVVARDWQAFYNANVRTTRSLLEAIEATPGAPTRFVLVSSTGASGPGRDKTPVDESSPPAPVGDYGRSKLMAERTAEAFSHRVPVTIVRPCAVYGPRDRNFLIMFRHARSGLIPVLGSHEQYISLIHVRDLTRGIVLAALHPRTRDETYFLTSERAHTRTEILATAERAAGAHARRLVVPDRVLAAIPLARRVLDAVHPGARLLSAERLATLSHPYWAFDGHKALAHFGFRPHISLASGFEETYAWYLSQGWLARRR